MSKGKILITGCNKNQCTRKHYLNQQLKVVPSHYSLYNCLVAMGYEVEQRVVEIGEDLSQYTDVIVFLAGPRQLVAGFLFNGLWALSARPDAIVAYDDWQIPEIFKAFEKCGEKYENLFCEFILNVNKKTEEELRFYSAQFINAIHTTVLEKKNRILISAFDTTHLNDDSVGLKLLFDTDYPQDRLFRYNPNPYHRNRTPGDYSHEGKEDPTFRRPNSLCSAEFMEVTPRERRFNFASLVQSATKKWLKSQGINIKNIDKEQLLIADWPVDLYGSKAESQKRLTEDQMCEVFAKNWGCLMPGYSHSGSGWWRARPLQVADAKAILIGDPKEMQVYYGKDFKYNNLIAKDLINLSDTELNDIAMAQQSAIYSNHLLHKSIQENELRKILMANK